MRFASVVVSCLFVVVTLVGCDTGTLPVGPDPQQEFETLKEDVSNLSDGAVLELFSGFLSRNPDSTMVRETLESDIFVSLKASVAPTSLDRAVADAIRVRVSAYAGEQFEELMGLVLSQLSVLVVDDIFSRIANPSEGLVSLRKSIPQLSDASLEHFASFLFRDLVGVPDSEPAPDLPALSAEERSAVTSLQGLVASLSDEEVSLVFTLVFLERIFRDTLAP